MDIIERLNDLSKMQTWNYNQTKKGIVCHDAIAEITVLRAQVAVNQKDADHEPLYNRKTLLYVCHEMAVAMIPQLSNGVAVCYDYNIIIDAAIDKAMAE